MSSNDIQQAISNTIDNVIWREVDCFTDEIIHAKNIYHFSSISHNESVEKFLNNFNSQDIESNYKMFDFSELSDEDLLIIITYEESNELLLKLTNWFKKNGGRVITLIENRNSDFTKHTHEVLGVNINKSDSVKVDASNVFENTVPKLLEQIESKAKRILSMTKNNYSYV